LTAEKVHLAPAGAFSKLEQNSIKLPVGGKLCTIAHVFQAKGTPVNFKPRRSSMATPSTTPGDMHGTLKIQDYLDASGDATKRTRRVLLTMVVASVLTSVGILNSLQSSWKQARLLKYMTPSDPYLVDLIGTEPPAGAPQVDVDLYRARYQQMFAAVARAYVDTNSIQIPFFQIGIDINDLGFLSGFSLVIILIWFRLCVRIEIENLNLAFAESRRLRQLPDLYQLLAMRQVMISPTVPGRIRHIFYWLVPLFICALPAAAYASVLVTDSLTSYIGYQLGLNTHTNIVIWADFVFTVAILWLTLQAFLRWLRLDHAWTWYWCEYVIVTERAGRSSTGQSTNRAIVERLEENLKKPLEKLLNRKMEEAVLLQLDMADEGDFKVYKYSSEKVVLKVKIDREGRLRSWEFADAGPMALSAQSSN
jgi:hypothetical protein